jgi:hypothetical protein
VLGNCLIGSIGIAEIEQAQQSRARCGRSAATINSDVGTLITLLRWAKDRAWTPKTEASARTIPITAELTADLRQPPRQGPYVFHGSDRMKPLTSIKRVLATASERAAIASLQGEKWQQAGNALPKPATRHLANDR